MVVIRCRALPGALVAVVTGLGLASGVGGLAPAQEPAPGSGPSPSVRSGVEPGPSQSVRSGVEPGPSQSVRSGVGADTTFKKPLDHDVYDTWLRIQGETLSSDGTWVLYSLLPGDPEGDGTLKIRSVAGEQRWEIVRGSSAAFTWDARHAIYLVRPNQDDVKAKRKALQKAKAKDIDNKLPKAKLEIIDLASGQVVTIDRVKSYRIPEKAGGWVAYLLEKPLEPPDTKTEAKQEQPEGAPEATPPATPPAEEKKPEAAAAANDEKKDEKKKDPGTTLVLRNLATGAEMRFEDVIEYALSEDGTSLMFATSVKPPSPPDAKAAPANGDAGKVAQAEAAAAPVETPAATDGVHIVTTSTGAAVKVMSGLGHYKSLAIDKPGKDFAFLSDRDTYEDRQPEYKVYHWAAPMNDARMLAAQGSPGIPDGWWVSDNGRLSFSEKGSRLFCGTAPRPEPEKTAEEKEAEAEIKKAVLDIWNWQDQRLQPQQLIERQRDLDRTYQAVIHLDTAALVQLANEDMPGVDIANKGDGDLALAVTDLSYEMLSSWDTPSYNDAWLIDVRTGEREKVLERMQARMSLSPLGKYLLWWDGHARHWFAMNTATKKIANLTEVLPHAVHDELHDSPSIPGSEGSAGWVEDDQGVLLYDRYDIWLAHPDGFFPPSCVTDEYGRANHLRLRFIDLDPDEEHIDSKAPMLLSAFNERTKASGFARDIARGTEPPHTLIMADERFGRPQNAEESDELLLTRERFEIFPDLWIADPEFKGLSRLSRANPQQDQYRWGTTELVEWTSADGERLQGFLCKPDGFDPSRTYPMMVYFYERNSDLLHQHVAPEPVRSIINRTFYVSRGYLVFVPDIPYRVGYPGESAMNAVIPGVTHLINKGFVDEKRIGVEGHSWGGYQIAYMITRTNIFACAEAGAPVSNMTSAYGGIRWQTGLSRMFQYERTQSRIGGTLWDAQQRYIENSPVFWADKVNTPLLMMHNDEDGAVPWYQGIEYFVALRRLSKPVWMLNYNGEQHGLTKWENRKDWAVRMQQFFDHYLKDDPAPKWMAEGVPAVEKGKDLGLGLVGVEPQGDMHDRFARRKAERNAKFSELAGGVLEMVKTSYLSSIDGLEIPVYVFQSLVRRGDAAYPALVWVHGGVHGDLDPEHYWPFIREAVEKGYVVVAPEYRGSTGYGAKHYDAIDYGGYEIDDCLDAVAYIKDRLPHVDSARLGMIGWSHGGFITLHAMFRDHDAFKCAVANVPVTNLVFRLSYKGPRYQEAFREQERIDGLPHEKREVYIERSPVYHVDRIATPMLVHVADNDDDVDFVEAEQLIHALMVKKPDLVRTKIYHDPPGGHTFNRQVNWADGGDYSRKDSEAQIDSWNLIWAFLDEYLLPRE